MTDDRPAPAGSDRSPQIDTTRTHSARIWNYWMGGKDHYPIDRLAGDAVAEGFPEIVDLARTSREFLIRVVTHLTRDVGIRQFLDIGTGMPTANNTHEVAQSIAPESRVVYVDNDPLVLAHARALLVGSPEGATDYIDADLRDPDTILERAAETLDFDRPIALMLMGILGHIPEDEVQPIVRRLLDALPSGSHLASYDGADTSEAYNAAIEVGNKQGDVPYLLRSPEFIAARFEGLELLEPGVVPCPLWRPAPIEVGTRRGLDQYGGVARKP
ncbi:SAM-dependent methyltransferase [Nocardiopsis lambiniae]|uniref:SAM-dependent methyltransferase n=1 Tax=Nocardiopsis lambiniae TaxID=3075539 RepID=A0ABU2M8G5_9ACTN|nr:SAM-dependent methyltransferase [Nocardiopsis sp. DSM 44743]MDT0328900.1 SAM-dependent methyltransferase [Nocardiopsis sp. DSM 44743]